MFKTSILFSRSFKKGILVIFLYIEIKKRDISEFLVKNPRTVFDKINLKLVLNKNNKKLLTINLLAILLCFGIAFGFSVLVKANPDAKVQFTADTILSLSGISDGDLYIANTSECDSLTVSGSALTVSDIPAGSSFILKTSDHNNALKLTPSGGTLGLTFVSSNLATSTGTISQWTLDGSGSTNVAHIVGTSQANTYYAIKVDNVLFNSYQSNSSGEVSFTYNGGFSSKTFTIEEDTTAPTEFDLVSPVNDYSTSDTTPTFSWNACSDSDLGHYELYIDSSLNTDNISNTSITLTNALSCGEHTWYVKAIDKAGNSTQSASTFTISISCGGGLPPEAYNPPTPPSKGFLILIQDGVKYTNNRTVILKLDGGPDAKKMAISNFADFYGAGQEIYQTTKIWKLPKDEGEKTVYVKFYTQWGQSSPVISDTIILRTIPGKSITDMTVNTLKQKIAEILAKIAQLKTQLQQLRAPTPNFGVEAEIPSDYRFNVNLKYGQMNENVKYLQLFLKSQGHEIYPEGIVSGWFGPLTKKAVICFQEKYASDILAPWELSEGTGFIGKTTREKINEILGR